jgi:hypothetical protein
MEPTASSPESSKVKSGAKVNQYPMNTITVVMANVSQSTRWKSGATGAGDGSAAVGEAVAGLFSAFEVGSAFFPPWVLFLSALMQGQWS